MQIDPGDKIISEGIGVEPLSLFVYDRVDLICGFLEGTAGNYEES